MKQFQCYKMCYQPPHIQPLPRFVRSRPVAIPDGVRGVARDRIDRVARVSSSMRSHSRAVGDARDGVDDEFKQRRLDGRVVRAARGRAARGRFAGTGTGRPRAADALERARGVRDGGVRGLRRVQDEGRVEAQGGSSDVRERRERATDHETRGRSAAGTRERDGASTVRLGE